MLILIAQFLMIIILAAIAGAAIVVALVFAEMSSYTARRGKFDWHYLKFLLAYKTKVLTDELQDRDVKMEELYKIMDDALDKKSNKKHVLDEIEEEVKGDVKEAGKGK